MDSTLFDTHGYFFGLNYNLQFRDVFIMIDSLSFDRLDMIFTIGI